MVFRSKIAGAAAFAKMAAAMNLTGGFKVGAAAAAVVAATTAAISGKDTNKPNLRPRTR